MPCWNAYSKCRDPQGNEVLGNVMVGEEETRWSFTPQNQWGVGAHHIDVAANLEDVSGNSIARPFEVKMQERSAANPSTTIAIEFIVE